MSLLDTLYRGGWLRVIDHALGQSLRRLDPTSHDSVLAAAALASLAIGQGHAAFDPAQPASLVDAAIDWPDAAAWCAALRDSRWVATPQREAVADPSAPLVLEHELLYLRRYREYERRLAAGLQRLAAQVPPTPVDIAALAPLFDTLFPDARESGGCADGGQARAAALALLRSLLLVTGGPGTGKTTTITRLLLLLLASAQYAGIAPPRIALAAPTGRAAERMASSVRAAVLRLRGVPGIADTLCDALPAEARTLHRLLGTIPDSPRFRHDAGNPLPFEVIVVDEASMVDLPLMCKLVEAVADGARLILLGDRDQLPSVEAGDVLAAICDAADEAPSLPAELALLFDGGRVTYAADAVAPVATDPAAASSVGANFVGANSVATTPGDATSVPIVSNDSVDTTLSRPEPFAQRSARPLSGHRVQLTRGYRQSDQLDLAPLATAARDGDADAALSLLRDQALAGVHWHEDLLDPLSGATREPLLAPWRALVQSATADDPAAALAQAARARLLTALREGPQGANVLNARIEEALAGAHRDSYFHGRLLLVTANSYRHGLFNGDIGVCLRTADSNATVAWFAGGSGGVRGFHPAALPAHSGAFAMTVHKAQGSEFDAVWLLLPREDARSSSRELLYTAITRARSSLHLCTRESVLRAALARHAARVSGLSLRLVTAP